MSTTSHPRDIGDTVRPPPCRTSSGAPFPHRPDARRDHRPAQHGDPLPVLVDGEQVAVFRTADGGVHALSSLDPFSGAMVLSRGIVGSRGDRPTVASPVHKQVSDLETGQCLDDPAARLPVHLVRVRDGPVEVALEVEALSA